MDVGYCEHPDCPDPEDIEDGPNATNRRGDAFFCGDHIGTEDVDFLLDQLVAVTKMGSAADQCAGLCALLERNGRKVL